MEVGLGLLSGLGLVLGLEFGGLLTACSRGLQESLY